MEYLKLANLYQSLSNTSKRLEKIQILSEFLKTIPDDQENIIHLIQGNIYPNYDEKKIGISEQLAIKSLSKSTGTPTKTIISQWKKIGDIGEVAKELSKNKQQTTLFGFTKLTTSKVLQNLKKLPSLSGDGTESKKINIIAQLLTAASPIEAKYIIRTVIGDMRIGVQESTIKSAILKAFFENNKEYDPIIQQAIDKSNDLEKVFKISKLKDIEKLKEIKLKVNTPIKAMLASKVQTPKEALKQLGSPLAAEYKYDGFRILIHKKDDKVTLYTRRLENVTKQFPEINDYVKKYVNAKSFILDAEAVGYDKKTKKYTDFQNISQRIKRKHKIDQIKDKLPIELNVFDILFYNGESQIEKPFSQRLKLVRQIITPHPFKIIPSKIIITNNEKEIKNFYKKALSENQEGIMLKSLDAPYKPGRRVGQMLKLKPEDKELDLVITGGEWGSGKRSGWISSFNLACKDNDQYLEIGKVGTGISEKEESGNITFNQLTNLLKPLIISETKKEIKVKPQIIVTVTYQDIQKSTNYKSGYALRFPRVTMLRNDKPLSEIASLNEIKTAFIKERTKRRKNY